MTKVLDHSHFSHYGTEPENEMACWQALQAARLALRPGQGTTQEICDTLKAVIALAHSAGYGEADSYLVAKAKAPSVDAGLQAAQDEIFENWMDGDYCECLIKSERCLKDAGVPTSRAIDISALAIDAFGQGRQSRIDQEPAAVEAAAPAR